MRDVNGASARRLASEPSEGDGGKRLRVVATSADPLSKVLTSGPRIPLAVTIAGAILLHVGMAAGATAAALYDEIFTWQRGIRDVVGYRLSQYEVEIVREEEPPPPPPPVAPEPEPEEAKPVAKEQPTPQPETPPPQPAEAAKVLTSDPTPDDDPLDLTKDGFVTGSGSTYAGGTTSSTGTSKTAVYNPAAAKTGVPGGTGTAPAPPPPRREDRSRLPGLVGSTDWDCPFPGEADAEQVDRAVVLIKVQVRPDGTPENVTVLQDPGHGFGREARRCAMRKTYSHALDPDGNPIAGTTKPFRVSFDR